MGLLELLLGKDNPVASWANQNSNTLGNLGAGIAAGGLGKGFGYAAQNAGAARAADVTAQQQMEAKNLTKDWLHKNGFDDLIPLVDQGKGVEAITMAYKAKMERDAPQNPVDPSSTVQGRTALAQQFKLPQDVARSYILEGKLPGGNQAVRAGVGQPIYGKNRKTGQIEPWQSMTDGTMVNTANPQANPADYDFDPGLVSFQRAEGTAVGRAQGGVQAAAPGDIGAANTALDLIQQIKTSPELGWATGMSAPLNAVPGTGRHDFQVLVDQAKGGAFLAAVQQMRGLGALSNNEGAAATQAIARMETSQTKDAFVKALEDYEAIIKRGLQKARAILENSPYQQQIAPPGFPESAGGTSGGADPLGIR